ncbi:hypothetical protein DDZ15_06145 [Rhodohalobacter mucosus]|uniref:Uncharacterized protein n=2 Tax=Rhodohalobacter mucosus TaxID=2079485 RepID=A0A316TQF6_9BACT|nr:hypothetical protein DDZ15_06145 [Rhodohalobacter mucosus]
MGEATPVDDRWIEASGPYYFVDYSAREWYGYAGIDLAGDTTSSVMASFRQQNPTRSYWFSTYGGSFFYNYPGYTNSYLYSTFGPFVLGNANIIPGVFHPPYFSNQYTYSFFYDRWAQWYYWDSERPNSWCYNPFQLSAFYGSSLPCGESTSTSLAHSNYDNNKVLRDRLGVNPAFNRSEKDRVGEDPDLNIGERDRVLARKFDENGVRALRSRTEILRNRINNVRVEQIETGISREAQMIRWAIEYHERNRSSRSTFSNYNRNSSRNSGVSHNSGISRTGSSVNTSSGSSGRTRSGTSTTRENNN